MVKRIVIVGATSAIAEYCARNWAESGEVELILVGRDARRIERVAADLRVRSPSSPIRVVEMSFESVEAIGSTVDALVAEVVPNIVLIAHGSLSDQEACQHDLQLVNEALHVNGVSPVLFAEAFAKSMENAGCGTIAVIGSVAGDRGRKTNYVYGAAKGLVERYAEGLQHRLAAKGVNIVLVKPGPTDTPMTADLKVRGARLAPVEQVAQEIVKGIDAGKRLIYVPGKWRWIMFVIRHLPAFIFNKLNI